MTITRTNRSLPARKIERLVKLLEEQQQVLTVAGCEKRMLAEYAALIRFLRAASPQELRRIFSGTALVRKSDFQRAELSEVKLASIPAEEVEMLIRDESVTRRHLESIAIHRFNVPRGSMRSFSNREMLVQKLQTLLRNEQAHVEIENVARRHL